MFTTVEKMAIAQILLVVFGVLVNRAVWSSKCESWKRDMALEKMGFKGHLSMTYKTNGFFNCTQKCSLDSSCGIFTYDDQSDVCSVFYKSSSKNPYPIRGRTFHRGLNGVYLIDPTSGLDIAIYNRAISYTLASDMCSNAGGRLLVLDTEVKRERIVDLLKVLEPQSYRYWIGLRYNTSDREWRWENDLTIDTLTPLRSHLDDDGQYCGSLTANRRIYDAYCTTNFRFICEKV